MLQRVSQVRSGYGWTAVPVESGHDAGSDQLGLMSAIGQKRAPVDQPQPIEAPPSPFGLRQVVSPPRSK